MTVYWTIYYFDRKDHAGERPYKVRWLRLETESLDAATRAAVEYTLDVLDNQSRSDNRNILKFRNLFVESGITEVTELPPPFRTFALTDYFEDELGEEITMEEIASIRTGGASVTVIPPGAKQHDIDFILSESLPVPLAEVALSADDTKLLAYFVRDIEELVNSTFMKEGGARLSGSGPFSQDHCCLTTAVTDEELRSYVTILRRLYMENERADFRKAVHVFVASLGNHPLANWVDGTARLYEATLLAPPAFGSCIVGANVTFSAKRLIDVFLYTQYAHQPDERKERQFRECLKEVAGSRNTLTWMFLSEIWGCGLLIGNAGRVIAKWFTSYCDHHHVTPDVLKSLRSERKGLGTDEKKKAREERLFREKVEELELSLWKEAGRPEGGPVQFRREAEQQIRDILRTDAD